MGCGVALKFLIFILSMNLSIGRAAERDQEMAYVADPVGNPLSKPSKVPAKVGSPTNLIRPDRYEFYTFDETGELIKRLMTLEEIQEIIATGDGDDGHMLTVAQADSSKPPVTFNFQPPTHVKVHTIVNSVQNVLKAEMEAQKTNPPKPTIFDTPDVSSSWSMILPAIFGNTGGSISPDSMISSHVEPETDVINVPNNLEPEEEMFDDVEDDYETTIAPMHRESDDRTVKPDVKIEKTTYVPVYEKISITSAAPLKVESYTKPSEIEVLKTTQAHSTTNKPIVETKTEKISTTTVKFVPVSHSSVASASTEKIVTKVSSPIIEKITENYVKLTSESVTKATPAITKATTTATKAITTANYTTTTEKVEPSTTKATTTPKIETAIKEKIELIRHTTKAPTTPEQKTTTTTGQPSTSTTIVPIRQKPQLNKEHENSSNKNVSKPSASNDKLVESKKPDDVVLVPIKESSYTAMPILDMSEIIHKIAMDLNDDGSAEQLVPSTTSAAKPSTTTTTSAKPLTSSTTITTTTTTTTTTKPTSTANIKLTNVTTTISPATVAIKIKPTEAITEKLILKTTESTTSKVSPTTEKLVSTLEPSTTEQGTFIKIQPIIKNEALIESKVTIEPEEVTTEIEMLNDEDFLEQTNPTTSGYFDVTKPDLHELSGSITDLISQIVEESRPSYKPTTIKENFNSPTTSTTKYIMSSSSTTQKITSPNHTTESSKIVTKLNEVPKDYITEKPLKIAQENENSNKSTLLIIVEDFNDSSQNDTADSKEATSEDIIPTTYRPVPLFFRSTTKVPNINNYVQISSSTPSNAIKPDEYNNNITYEKIENINKTSYFQVTETLTTVSPIEDEFDVDVELVTSDTFIDDYETTTDNVAQDDELMDMINQVSQLFQSNSPSKIRNDDEVPNNEKKTSYKKTDITVEEIQSTTEKKIHSEEENSTLTHIKIDLISSDHMANVSNDTVKQKEENKNDKISQSKISPKEENKPKIEGIEHNITKDSQTVISSPVINKQGQKPTEIKETVQSEIDVQKKQNNQTDASLIVNGNLKEKIKLAPKIELIDLENTTKVNDKRKVGNESFKNENKVESGEKNDQASTTTRRSVPLVSTIPDNVKLNENLQITTQLNSLDEKKIETDKGSSERPITSTENLNHVTTSKTVTESLPNIRLEGIIPVISTELRNNFNNKNDNETWKLESILGKSNVSREATTTKIESTTPVHYTTDNVYNRVTTTRYQNLVHRLPLPNIDETESIKSPPQGLEKTTANLGQDVLQFSQLCNELAFKYWESVSSNGVDVKRSLVVSPFAVTSLLAMMFLGARGATSGEMNDILKLDEMVTFNPHIVFKNVTESIEVSKKSGVATSAFVRELYSDKSKGRLLSFYKDRVQQFYGGHVEEINFNSVGDIVRRRTNLLVKRQTWGKIPEYVKGNNMVMRPPLSVFAANIFQTDCSAASTDGRNGEMYFVVSPTIRQRRLVPVPAVLYKDGFLAGYVPELDATVAAISGGEQIISTILLMPGQQGSTAHGDDIIDLQKRIVDTAFKDKTWSKLLRSLLPRPGLELQIPRFSHRSVENGSLALQKMGLKDLFTAEKADLRGLNGLSNDLYLSDMTLVNTFTTCGEGFVAEQHHVEVYPGEPNKAQRRLWRTPHRPVIQDIVDPPVMTELLEEPRDYQRAFHDPLHDNSYLSMPLHLRPRQARLPDGDQEAPKLKFDRPFMFFIRHNPTGLILHMGRYNPRLLP